MTGMVEYVREAYGVNGDDALIARYGAPEQAKRLGALLDAASAERFGSWQRARN